MEKKIVPIRFVDRLGQPAELRLGQPGEAIPVMDVVFRYEPASPPPTQRIHEMTRIALVDTGADHNYATKALIESVGAPAIRGTEVQSATSTMKSVMYDCHLLFPTARTSVATNVHSTDLVDRCYDLVIGRMTLQLGRLTMDYIEGRFYWEIG